jgi:hypothetical protein
MNAIKSFDDALDFYPGSGHRSALARVAGGVRLYFEAMRDGLAAARHYHKLTVRGVAHDVAVAKVFGEHFGAR